MLAWRFFGGGVLALGIAAIVHRLLTTGPLLSAYAMIFALAAALMLVSSISFVSAGEPPAPPFPKEDKSATGFQGFMKEGLTVLKSDGRFRLFLYTQWLGGATLMALPFYVVAATGAGLGPQDVGILLAAQTAGSLASNALWGRIGDSHGKLRLLQSVGLLRLAPPLGMLAILMVDDLSAPEALWSFAALFFAIGALVNGMTIGYLGYLMEISPDDRRPAYSAYFNTLASPAALLPLVGALIADALSLNALFTVAAGAAILQLYFFKRLARWEDS
jgi:MFS family permease